LASEVTSDGRDQVTIVDDLSRGRDDPELRDLLARANVRLVSADLATRDAWDDIGSDYDEVYHFAAVIGVRNVIEAPQHVLRVNMLSTLYLLDWLAAGGGTKVVFASTSEAYAWTSHFYNVPIPTPEDVPLALTDLSNPRSSYAGSKIFGELAVAHACRSAGKPFVVMRYHNVYGPRMGMDHVIPEVLKRALDGENPLAVYSADNTRAFCYVSDAVSGTIAAMRTPEADGATINIGNDAAEVKIRDLVVRLLDVAGLDVRIVPALSENDPIERRCPDLTRARRLLRYEPRVSLDVGLARTTAWYVSELRRGANSDASRRGRTSKVSGTDTPGAHRDGRG
jgi:UDP-glucose 4-epimerase/UDP-glucuronate decarboxylase